MQGLTLMQIQILGLNYKSAPVEIREKLSFPESRIMEALNALRSYGSIRESVILSTCNRVEIYAVSEFKEDKNAIISFLEDFHGLNKSLFEGYLYFHKDIAAIRHLFRVVPGLDSMVIGENQITGQVKRAYLAAYNSGCAGRIFYKLFEEALELGKKVRNETSIGKGAVSAGSISIELAKKIFGSLENRRVLVIGAGKMGELTLKHLSGRGIKILVVNRKFKKAEEIAEKFGGTALSYNKLPDCMKEADIIISATSAPGTLLHKKEVLQTMALRQNRPLFLIDLGVPRNIACNVSEVDNVHLYNIDDIGKVKDANIDERLGAAKKAELIIEEKIHEVWPALGIEALAGVFNYA